MESQISYSSLSQVKQQEDNEIAGFVYKTFEIVSNKQFHKIIYWAPNGLEFIIKDVVRFEQIVLPRYFRHKKINSFVRQLNMYGFHKIKHNSFRSTFYHQFFQKDRQDLLSSIKKKFKFNDKENEISQEVKPVLQLPPKDIQNKPAVIKQENTTLYSQKWADITQQFLTTNKMINMSLVKVTLNQLVDMIYIPEQNNDDCVSFENQLQDSEKQEQQFYSFQDPACFFASKFDL